MELNAGIATILRGRNTAENGEMPHIVYDEEVFRSYYAEKTVGFQRFYTAQSNGSQADLLIEIQRCSAVRPLCAGCNPFMIPACPGITWWCSRSR